PDPGGASTPISAELEAHLELGALVGGRRSITTPTPGRYASLLRASQRRFITMEHTVAESIDGGASIELHPDGRVEACFWATARSGGSISRFASRDGEDHHNQSEHRQRLGARGSWRAEPDASSVIVRLDALQWRTCQAGAEAWQPPAPIELPCHALAA